MGRDARGAGAVLVLPLVALLGCGSGTSGTPGGGTARAGSSATAATSTPSPTATPVGTGPTVVATAAAATPSGTVVFVVVTGDATPRAAVHVMVSAASSNGRATVTGQSTISELAAGATQAAMVRLQVPANDTIGSISAAVTGTATTAPMPGLKATGAAFVPDAIEPGVDVTVTSPDAVSAEIVAVCYQGTALIGGGVAMVAHVRAGGSVTYRLAAALSETPTSCTGYAYLA